jgi:hypothetical protein
MFSLVNGTRPINVPYKSVLREYVPHYNERRPHRGLDLGVPNGRPAAPPGPVPAEVHRHDVLGGLVHEYEAAAA